MTTQRDYETYSEALPEPEQPLQLPAPNPPLQRKLVHYVREEQQLDAAADLLHKKVDEALSAAGNRDKLMRFLQGQWLGHPLHPALTDIPVGAWTLAGLIDLLTLYRKRPTRSSNVAVAVGLMGSAMSAVSGLADWYDMEGKARRVGTAHALMNATAAILYALSLICRLGRFGPARMFSFLGFGIAATSAYLGGEMVFGTEDESSQ